MDYMLIALIGLIVLALVVSQRYHSRTWSGRPGYRYQRVLSVGVVVLLLAVTGAIGWDVSQAHGLFGGMKWVDGPIWWQLGLGVGMVAVAVFSTTSDEPPLSDFNSHWDIPLPLRTGG